MFNRISVDTGFPFILGARNCREFNFAAWNRVVYRKRSNCHWKWKWLFSKIWNIFYEFKILPVIFNPLATCVKDFTSRCRLCCMLITGPTTPRNFTVIFSVLRSSLNILSAELNIYRLPQGYKWLNVLFVCKWAKSTQALFASSLALTWLIYIFRLWGLVAAPFFWIKLL